MILRKGERRIGDFIYLFRKTNEHKFRFRWVERQKVGGHPG